MNSWLKNARSQLAKKRLAIYKITIIGLLIFSLTACAGKATGKDVAIKLSEQIKPQKDAQLSQNISEVVPPEVIRELRPNLEIYRPQVEILNPQPDEVLERDKLKVNLQVKDLPVFKDAKYGIGSHLELILDNEPGIEVYDLNQPVELSNLFAGTHTLRVFASRPWNESFKNEGAYAQLKFHVFTKSDDNNPDTGLPIITYNSPEGSYGAEPILLDFYLTNAPLHILAKDNPENPISDWRIRCTINGESFILDRWQSPYLTGFNKGKNWVKLEFLDNQGNPFKNVFNSTVRTINYEPNGEDTLAKIVRGELSAADVRGIVDENYASTIPVESTPEEQLEATSEESKGGFFNRFKRGKEDKEDKIPTPETSVEATPEVIETPQPETELETTTPDVIETPETETELETTTPEVIETPETETSETDTTEEIIPEEESEATTVEENQEVIENPESKVEETPPIIEIPAPEVIKEQQPEAQTTETIESPTIEEKTEIEETNEVLNTEEATVESTPDLTKNQPETLLGEETESKPEVKQSTTERLRGYFKYRKNKTEEVTSNE